MFESDGRRELLRKLGFTDMIPSVGSDALAVGVDGLSLDGQPSPGVAGGGALGLIGAPSGGGAPEDFFDQQQDEQDFFDKLPEQVRPVVPFLKTLEPNSSLDLHFDVYSLQDLSTGKAPRHSHSSSHTGRISDAGPGSPLAGGADASLEHEEEVQRALIAGAEFILLCSAIRIYLYHLPFQTNDALFTLLNVVRQLRVGCRDLLQGQQAG